MLHLKVSRGLFKPLWVLLPAMLALHTPILAKEATKRIEVYDYFGKQVFTPPINRAIIIGSYAEVPAMFGIWDKIVGLSSYGFKSDIVRATAKNLGSIKNIKGDHYTAINVEEVKKLKPDVIVTFVGSRKLVEFAKKFNLHVLSFLESSVKDAMDDIAIQAKVFGVNVDKKMQKMHEILDFVAKRLKNVPPKKGLEIFDKLNKVSGKKAISSDILQKAGVDNIGSKYVDFGRAEMSVENMIKENPEVIFIWWISSLQPKDVLNNPKFKSIKAVKNKQVYKLPTMDIAGPRTPLIVLYAALKTHPEAFKGVDINKIVADYYKVMFGLEGEKVKPFLWH